MPTPPVFDAPVRGPCRNIATTYNMKKTRMVWLHDGENYFEDMITRFDTIHERDRQTDRQTDTLTHKRRMTA